VVLVQFVEGSDCEILSALVHGATHVSQEFIVVDRSVSVGVEQNVQLVNFVSGETETVVTESLVEFIGLERLGVVVVHYSERASQTNHASRASGLQFVSQLREQVFGFPLLLLLRRLLKEHLSEFFIVNLAAVVLVVVLEDSPHLIVALELDSYLVHRLMELL